MASRAAGARARAQLSLGVMAHGFSSRALCARPVLHLQVWGHHSTCKLARRPAQRPPWQGPRTRFKIRIQPTHPPGPAWRCSSVALLASMAAVNSRHRLATRPVTRARACMVPRSARIFPLVASAHRRPRAARAPLPTGSGVGVVIRRAAPARGGRPALGSSLPACGVAACKPGRALIHHAPPGAHPFICVEFYGRVETAALSSKGAVSKCGAQRRKPC